MKKMAGRRIVANLFYFDSNTNADRPNVWIKIKTIEKYILRWVDPNIFHDLGAKRPCTPEEKEVQNHLIDYVNYLNKNCGVRPKAYCGQTKRVILRISFGNHHINNELIVQRLLQWTLKISNGKRKFALTDIHE